MLIFVFMWVRWSFPRFRYDQLMSIGWKVMIPLGLVNLVASAFAQEFLPTNAYAIKMLISWGVLALCVLYAALKAAAPSSNAQTHLARG